MNSDIRSYVSRYIVPFYFDYENEGYNRICQHFIECKTNCDVLNSWYVNTVQEDNRAKDKTKRKNFKRKYFQPKIG